VSSSDQPDALLGQVVAGRYEVLRKLNEGGMGAVYLAMQRPLDRPVALKVLLKKHADDPTAIRRFEKEAAAVARLAHAHIVTLYDFGTTDAGDLYIAMELLRGQSVREILDAAGFLPWERSLHMVIGVTRALVAAHTQKIVHRDLKPENVMLVESNGDLDFAKVLDFGLARSIMQGNNAQITRHDVIPGTPAYMSPERANGISDDPRSDLYALGAMWFELLVGEPPFPGETSIKVILRHVHEVPRKPSAAQPHNKVPPFIDDIIARLLAKAPDDRPANARALLDEIELMARPSGWHVGRNAEVARRGDHDDTLREFSAVAATLLDDDDIRFDLEVGGPMPLVKKKPAAAQPTVEIPVLLTRKKSVSADISSSVLSPPSGSVSSSASPWQPPPPLAPAPPAPSMPTSRGQSTEDFLRQPGTLGSRAQAPGATDQMPGPGQVQTHGGPVLAPPSAPPRIESVAQVAGWLSTARTTREVGELCCAFLQTRFDRVLIMDLRAALPMTMAQASMGGKNGPSIPAIVNALQSTRAVAEMAGRREAYYGPAVSGPEWMTWFGALGGTVPGAMFVGGLGREGKAAFLFYADHKEAALRPMVKDTVILLREAAAALSSIG
jgi:serine/threonine protein kinase